MGDEEDRKLFIGGLPQEVSQSDLEDYFGEFGEIDSVKLKMDPMTGRSRGFAFLLYKDEDAIDAAAKVKEHKIKGKAITAKKADVKQGKIYVGKMPESGCDEDDIRNHFQKHGAIAEVIRPINKQMNNEPKNFCFVTFEKERVAKKLIDEGSCVINGHKMMIKQVTPNPRDPSQRGGGMGGGRGMRGGYGGMQGGGGYGGGWAGDQGYGNNYGGGYNQGYNGGGGGYGGGYDGGYDGGYGGGYNDGYGGGGYGGGYGDQGGYGGGYNNGYGGGRNMGGGMRGGGGKMRGRGGRGRGGPY